MPTTSHRDSRILNDQIVLQNERNSGMGVEIVRVCLRRPSIEVPQRAIDVLSQFLLRVGPVLIMILGFGVLVAANDRAVKSIGRTTVIGVQKYMVDTVPRRTPRENTTRFPVK